MKNKYYLLSLFALASASAFGATVDVIENKTWNSLEDAGVSAGDVVQIAGGKTLTVNFNSSGDDSKLLTFNYAGSTNTTNTSVNFGSAETGSATEYKNFEIYSAKNHLIANFYETSTGKLTFTNSADINYQRAKFYFGNNDVTYNVQGGMRQGTATQFRNYKSLSINAGSMYMNSTVFAGTGVVNVDTSDFVTIEGGVSFNADATFTSNKLTFGYTLVLNNSETTVGKNPITITFNSGKDSSVAGYDTVTYSSARIVVKNDINLVLNRKLTTNNTSYMFSSSTMTLNKDASLVALELGTVGDSGEYKAATQYKATGNLNIGSYANVKIGKLSMFNTESVLTVDFADETGLLTIDEFGITAVETIKTKTEDGQEIETIVDTYTGDIGISIVGSAFEQIKIKEGIKVGDTVVDENNFTNYFTAEDGKTLSLVNAGDGYYYVNATAAVPEPAEWAAIFGAIALGFVAYRRRK